MKSIKLLFGLLLCLNYFNSLAQETKLTSFSKISILTCGPGSDLYSSFGHDAIRVKDAGLGIDVVYNYGTFDFDTPNFYSKFARGKLLYQLSRNRYPNFLYQYQVTQRWVNEQELQLTQIQKQLFFDFLENNYLPENRAYKYDFFFDNCATRVRDGLHSVFKDQVKHTYKQEKVKLTFRELIHKNLRTNSWAAFGIDLALGSVIDKSAPDWDYMFLPAYLMHQLKSTTLNNQPIVAPIKEIIPNTTIHNSSSFLTTPLFVFLILLLLTIWITYSDFKRKSRNKWFDAGLFLSTGFIGLLILFLWFATDHSTTANNYNILWGFPLNLFFLYVAFTKKIKWAKTYLIVILILMVVAALLWIVDIQVFSPVLLPIWASLTVRYVFLHYHLTKVKTY